MEDCIYYNASLFNNSGASISPAPPGASILASYTEDRTTPLLERPQEWVGSVVRFSVPSQEIPLLYMDPYQSFIISLQAGPTVLTEIVGYTPRSGTADRLIYDYDHLVQLINSTLLLLYNRAVAAGWPGLTSAPIIIFNPSTRLFRLKVQSAAYSPEKAFDPVNTALSGVKIWFNSFLYSLFCSLPNYYNGLATNLTTGQTRWMLVEDQGDNVAGGFTTMTQQTSCLSLWNQISRLVLTTNSMPVGPEWVSTKLSTVSSSGDRPLGSLTISDFLIGASESPTNSSDIVYIPSGQFRYFNMLGSSPLRRIDMQFFWAGPDGNMFPVTIPVGQQMSIKIMFVRRDSPILR